MARQHGYAISAVFPRRHFEEKPVVALQITTLPAVPSGIWYIYQKKILDPESSGRLLEVKSKWKISINRQPKKWSSG